MKTTASIVVHQSPPKELTKALTCLEDSMVEKVYVVDNSPTDNLKDIAEKFRKVEYLHVENRGFGAGHNIAIRKSMKEGADYHLVMNADVWWDNDVIKTMLDYFEEHSDVGMMSPKTLYPDGSLQYTCRMLPTPTDLFFKRFLPSKISDRRMEKYLLKFHDHELTLNSPYLLGSFMLFRNEALKRVGTFDERFFMYPEDIDITRRLHRNFKTLYWPGVTIIHEHKQASRKNLKMFWIHLTNMIKYFNKWGWLKDPERDKYNKEVLRNVQTIKEN